MATHMTRLEFGWDDRGRGSPLEVTAIQAVAAVWLSDKNASRHAVMDIDAILDEPFSFAFNGLDAKTVIGLFDEIARQFPEVRFFVRGVGLEFGNIWLREYFNGEAVFAAGPFERVMEEEAVEEKRKGWFGRLLGG